MNEEDVKKAIQLVILPRATLTDQPDQQEQPPPPPPPPPPPSAEEQQEEEEEEEEEQDNEDEEQEQEVSLSLLPAEESSKVLNPVTPNPVPKALDGFVEAGSL